MSDDIKLGLGDYPDPIYLFVGELDGHAGCLWYRMNYQVEPPTPVVVDNPALTGYLRDIRITTKEFKGKPVYKLDVWVRADRPYVIRSGIESNFTRGLLLALLAVDDLSQPFVFSVRPSDAEKVVFASLYYALTGERVKSEWDAEVDPREMIALLRDRLGLGQQETGGTHEEEAQQVTRHSPAPRATAPTSPPSRHQQRPAASGRETTPEPRAISDRGRLATELERLYVSQTGKGRAQLVAWLINKFQIPLLEGEDIFERITIPDLRDLVEKWTARAEEQKAAGKSRQ